MGWTQLKPTFTQMTLIWWTCILHHHQAQIRLSPKYSNHRNANSPWHFFVIQTMKILACAEIIHPSFLAMCWIVFINAHWMMNMTVSGYFLCQWPKLTAISAELDIFMNDLTVESIDQEIACFQDGIKSHAVLLSDFDPCRAQLTCSWIYWLTEKGSTTTTSMYNIPKFWINLNGLIQNSNLNAMECCITHVFCMQGALIFHHWLSDIILATVNRCSCNMWLEKLAFDVRNTIEQKKEASFNSTDYLPNLAFPQV